MAPGVISGKNATKESDIYSIAMILWEISSGHPPLVILQVMIIIEYNK
jgi:serine/threonine protein kinase